MFIFGAWNLSGPDYVKSAEALVQQASGKLITVLHISGFSESRTASLHAALIILRNYFTTTTEIQLHSLTPVSEGILSLLSSAAGVAVKNVSQESFFKKSAAEMQAQIINNAKENPAKIPTLRQQKEFERQKIFEIQQDMTNLKDQLINRQNKNKPSAFLTKFDDLIRK